MYDEGQSARCGLTIALALGSFSGAVDQYDLICIYGDYDCDGVTSTTILYNYLESMGANVMYYIPEREAGYGMNMEAIEMLAEKGVKLIVTVDNGISGSVYNRGNPKSNAC